MYCGLAYLCIDGGEGGCTTIEDYRDEGAQGSKLKLMLAIF